MVQKGKVTCLVSGSARIQVQISARIQVQIVSYKVHPLSHRTSLILATSYAVLTLCQALFLKVLHIVTYLTLSTKIGCPY